MKFPQKQKPLLGSLINLAHPLAKGMVGGWLMNEGSGDKVWDCSGNGRHGKATNVIWTPSPEGIVTKYGGAYIVTDYVPLGRKGTIVIRLQLVTYHLFDNVVGNGNFNTDRNGVNLSLDVGTLYRLWVCSASGQQSVFSSAVDNLWHTYVFTWDGAFIRIYKDGALNGGPTAQTIIPISTVYKFTIGAATDFAYALVTPNVISHVFVYDRPFSAKDAAFITHSPYAMFEREPYWMRYVAGAGELSISVSENIVF
jgi:hypothetical protein